MEKAKEFLVDTTHMLADVFGLNDRLIVSPSFTPEMRSYFSRYTGGVIDNNYFTVGATELGYDDLFRIQYEPGSDERFFLCSVVHELAHLKGYKDTGMAGHYMPFVHTLEQLYRGIGAENDVNLPLWISFEWAYQRQMRHTFEAFEILNVGRRLGLTIDITPWSHYSIDNANLNILEARARGAIKDCRFV